MNTNYKNILYLFLFLYFLIFEIIKVQIRHCKIIKSCQNYRTYCQLKNSQNDASRIDQIVYDSFFTILQCRICTSMILRVVKISKNTKTRINKVFFFVIYILLYIYNIWIYPPGDVNSRANDDWSSSSWDYLVFIYLGFILKRSQSFSYRRYCEETIRLADTGSI